MKDGVGRGDTKISGTTQEVYLEVHPFNDYYYKWEKMKDDHDRTKNWLKSLKDSK